MMQITERATGSRVALRFWGRITLAWTLLALSACSPPPISVLVTKVGGHAALALSQDWGILLSQKKTPCIGSVEVFAGPGASENPIWKIQVRGRRQCVDIGSIVIGSAPPGFDTLIPLDTKRKGVARVIVMGIGAGEASITL